MSETSIHNYCLEDNIDRNEQTLTGMLKYGFTLLLIRLHNNNNNLKRVKSHQSNISRFRKLKHVFLTFTRIKFYDGTKKAILVVTKKYILQV